ncbi:MAG: glutathione S-transferase family protein, partial [Pseudomonadota bacterium]
MSAHYILYGSYASYYTAKVRGLLRKKGIPFVEQLPSHPRFREVVRPSSGTHRIPQLETPSGEVIQDSITIMDHLEAAHPQLPALPETPVQRLATHLMELFGSEGLVRLAWQYRWLFPGNEYFVKMDFGRSFRPQGSDEELMHYGNLIADRMLSRGQLATDDGIRAGLEAEYVALLVTLEAHFTEHPYLLGGHPSHADYSLMGALHAHMGRDPVPLSVMQNHAPRVFRWMEHMLVPEVQAPEFYDRPIAYPGGDTLPDTFKAVLAHLADRYAD